MDWDRKLADAHQALHGGCTEMERTLSLEERLFNYATVRGAALKNKAVIKFKCNDFDLDEESKKKVNEYISRQMELMDMAMIGLDPSLKDVECPY